MCSVHPEREACLQCMVCLKCKVPTHLSYHCSVDCLRSHWNLHKDYHKQHTAQANGELGRVAGLQLSRAQEPVSPEHAGKLSMLQLQTQCNTEALCVDVCLNGCAVLLLLCT